jgi:hypothetical protein
VIEQEIFLFIIIVHWIADFVLQDEAWALGKSKAWAPLLKHTMTYSAFWFIPVLLVTNDLLGTTLFVLITFVAHTITDYFTSRIVSKRFENKHFGSAIPNFGAFSTIGADQVLHYIQLVYTWNLLWQI